jgi:hypothetical protein
LVELICDAAKLVVFPAGRLIFAIGEREEITSSVIRVTDEFVLGVGFEDFSATGFFCTERSGELAGSAGARVGEGSSAYRFNDLN